MRAVVTVTDRTGGVSAPPYDTFNLAEHVGDDPAAVAENRRRLATRLDVPRVVFMQQVHGSDVRVVDETTSDTVPDVDGLVTTAPGLAIAVLVADCVPVVISGSRAVGVAHVGRRGIVAGVVAATVQALRRLDDGPLAAHVGPAVCGRCYEVPAPMQDDVCAVVPQARSTTRWGTPGVDLREAVRGQLAAADVTEQHHDQECTLEDARYFSFRRDGQTGRFCAAGVLR